MLNDRDQQLLTAYVDGELSARQRRAAMKLLRRSPEARNLLRQLQADSDALIRLALPSDHHAPDVSDPVIQIIVERGLQPGTPKPQPTNAVPVWKGLAAAAAVLLAVSAASYFYFKATQPNEPRRKPVVNQQEHDKDKDKSP